MSFLIFVILLIFSLIHPGSIVLAQSSETTIPNVREDTSVTSPTQQQGLPWEQKKTIVKAVDVKGNRTIGVATILSKIKTRVGQEYLQGVISDDLKRLYNTGYFSDVSVDREEYEGGFKVIFYVVEKSVIEKITFSRLKFYKTKVLLRKIRSKKGKFLDSKTLKDDVRTIEELYAKKGLTRVSVNVETDIDQLTNKTKIHFIVREGKRIKIKRIQIEGNTTFRDKKILRVIKTRADSLFTSGYLKEEILDVDMERIKSFYEKEGFIDTTASYEYESIDNVRFIVKINIHEGKRYYVDEITIAGNDVSSDQEIINVMKEIKTGSLFSRDKLTVDISNIRALYFDKGYIFANVRESTSLNPMTGKVAIRLDVEEGHLAYIHRIKIQGNDRTRDVVVRRELRLYPGDQFDGGKLRRSKERLRNLGYFEEISYDVEDTGLPDQKDLIVQVKETKTGTFSFGGGFSTVDQIVGFIEIEQKNFDFTNWPTFTGGGQNLSMRAESGSTRSNTRLSFTEPWIFDYPISGGFDAYITERERERDIGFAYDEKRAGGDIRFGKQFTEYISGGVTYRREEITIDDFADNVSADLLAERGENVISTLSFTVTRDSRDSVFSPTKGLYLSGTSDTAGGVLGGDKDFYRLSGRTSYFIPFKLSSVLELRLRAGIVNTFGDSSKVPIFERFFVGGARTIRGYDERQVGPLDPTTNDPIGGESMLVGNVEYTIPLIDVVKVAAFLDAGNVWAKIDDFASGNFKSGTGLGLRVKTPIGPVSLDYGYPLNDEPGEEERSGKFYFSVSRGF